MIRVASTPSASNVSALSAGLSEGRGSLGQRSDPALSGEDYQDKGSIMEGECSHPTALRSRAGKILPELGHSTSNLIHYALSVGCSLIMELFRRLFVG